ITWGPGPSACRNARSASAASMNSPAAAPRKAPEGWGGSSLDHVDPQAPGSVRARKPVTNDVPQPIESIPAPAAKEPAASRGTTPSSPEPSVAPLGPAVAPPPPANDERDSPAAETSASPAPARTAGHTT
ncbi:MAG: hypothetical protein ACKOEX_09010, partial [Planctomycetia bacterium]